MTSPTTNRHKDNKVAPRHCRTSPGAVDLTRIEFQGSRFSALAALTFFHNSAGSEVLSGHKMKHK